MNLALSDEQERIAASVAGMVAKLPAIIDDVAWKACAAAGWLGGIGLGAVEEALLLRELGRGVTPGPFRSTVLAGHVAVGAGESELAAALAAGEHRVGMEVGALALDARPGDLLLRLDGDRAELVQVESLDPCDGVDPGISFGRATTGPTVASIDDPAIVVRARVLVAAELLGIIEAARDMSADYALVRVQFDKPIGAFQAVKHRCADMAIAAYATEAQVLLAALYVDHGHPDAGFHAACAHVLAVDGARRSVADNVQNHGALGFTLEHGAHLFVRRAHVLEHVLGPLRLITRDVLAPAHQEFR